MRKRKAKRSNIPGRYLLSFAAVALILFLLQVCRDTIAGSRIDWISQHTAIADYFRKRFYSTHNLFPQFASELGGGQNIYYFAYYGLYHPLNLLSWLFPFLSMETWFQIIGILTHIADGLLCFLWLRRHTEEKASFIGALMLMLSTAVVYHTSAQVMFVQYMPFLLLMLIGTDIRRETGKGIALTAGTVGLILSSYYFVPAGLVATGLWILANIPIKGNTFRSWVQELIRQGIPVLYGGLLCLFYLAPVAGALLSGRGKGAGRSWKELLLPDFSAEKVLYNPYGLGLTAMAVILLCIWIGWKNCKERVLAVCLAVIFILPVCSWILNGGLYARSKVFLPFLPIVCYLCAAFFEKQRKGEIQGKKLGLGYAAGCLVLLSGMSGYSDTERALLIADLLVCGAGFLMAAGGRRKRQALAVVTICLMSGACVAEALVSWQTHVTKTEMTSLYDPKVASAVETALKENPPLSRAEVRGSLEHEKAYQNRIRKSGQNLTTCYSSLSNPYYTSFRKEIGLVRPARNCLMQDAQDNPLFLRFMGVRYLIGDVRVNGWEPVQDDPSEILYENSQTAPVSYLTAQVIPETEFQKLSWQEKQLVLLEYAAVPEGKEDEGSRIKERQPDNSRLQELEASIEERKDEQSVIQREKDNISVKAEKAVEGTISLERQVKKDEYVFLSFRVKNHCAGEDVSVTVQGIKNKLSSNHTEYYNENEVFHYTFQVPEGTQRMKVRFGKGDYEICGLECKSGRVDEERNQTLYQNPADLKLTADGDGYQGDVRSERGQWLITSIPFDENFQVSVDGERVKSEKVNSAFLGARIPEGGHKVEIRYRAPGSREGLAVSGGCILTGIIRAVYQRRKAG